MTTLGLDIGGANIKAWSNGISYSRSFALWRDPAGLAPVLTELLTVLPYPDRIAVTMTGELCDCYENKRQGVAAILDAVEASALGRSVRVWQTNGRFTDAAPARIHWLQTAASNWYALATFAGRYVPKGPALLIDIGSTTADFIPLMDGKPVPRGRTDPQRLKSFELIYKGSRRTPLCALTAGRAAAELFATTLDVYLIRGDIAEDANDRDTADGRPATKAYAHARVARMLGADLETCSLEERLVFVEEVHSRLLMYLAEGVERVARRLPDLPKAVILSGSGEFLARAVLQRQRVVPPCSVISLGERIGGAASITACAHAVAVLCQEQEG